MKKLVLILVCLLVFSSLCGFTTKRNSVVDIGSSTAATTESGNTNGGGDVETYKGSGSHSSGNNGNNGSFNSGSNLGGSLDDIDLSENAFGGDMLPKVDAEGFFQRLYQKLFSGLTVVQTCVAILIAILFVICIFMTIVSWIGNRGRVMWYVIGALVCALCFVADIYAVPILNFFKEWLIS